LDRGELDEREQKYQDFIGRIKKFIKEKEGNAANREAAETRKSAMRREMLQKK